MGIPRHILRQPISHGRPSGDTDHSQWELPTIIYHNATCKASLHTVGAEAPSLADSILLFRTIIATPIYRSIFTAIPRQPPSV